jgi:hypothetical protein
MLLADHALQTLLVKEHTQRLRESVPPRRRPAPAAHPKDEQRLAQVPRHATS